MESKLEGNSYATLDQFIYDARLIFNNCRSYNDSQSNCKLLPFSLHTQDLLLMTRFAFL